jgi:cation transport ATPase
VLRNGKEEDLHFNYIQVGDIVKIKAGMIIPVDGIVVRGTGC